MLLSTANSALVDAIQEASRRLRVRHNYGIAVIPDGRRVNVVLVDASQGDGRYLGQIKSVNGVQYRWLEHRIKQLKDYLANLVGEPAVPEPLVFFNEEHDGEYRRCWMSIRSDSWMMAHIVGGGQIVVPYNPTVC